MSEDDRIAAFVEQFSPDKAYKGEEFFKWHNILTGSCLFGRKQFVESHGLDLNAEYTVKEFISLCENDYGQEVIKKLKEKYESTLPV